MTQYTVYTSLLYPDIHHGHVLYYHWCVSTIKYPLYHTLPIHEGSLKTVSLFNRLEDGHRYCMGHGYIISETVIDADINNYVMNLYLYLNQQWPENCT